MLLCKERLIHDGQQFHQFQQNKQPHLTSKSLTTMQIRAYNVVNPGIGLGQAQTLLFILVALLTITVYTFIISTISGI